jgi:prepilin-type N-terminal cleavage/methylation domain-containing protein
MNKIKNKKGFTLIEIIMGMGIMVVLSASMFRIISVSNIQQGLIMNAEKVKAGIRLAQANSLAVPQESGMQHICGYGIKNQTDKNFLIYYLYVENESFKEDVNLCDSFGDLSYDNSSPEIKEQILRTIHLDQNYETIQGNDIFFKTPYGKIIKDGSSLGSSEQAFFEIENNKNQQRKSVFINSVGKIYINN